MSPRPGPLVRAMQAVSARRSPSEEDLALLQPAAAAGLRRFLSEAQGDATASVPRDAPGGDTSPPCVPDARGAPDVDVPQSVDVPQIADVPQILRIDQGSQDLQARRQAAARHPPPRALEAPAVVVRASPAATLPLPARLAAIARQLAEASPPGRGGPVFKLARRLAYREDKGALPFRRSAPPSFPG